jgi:hypothetical protein
VYDILTEEQTILRKRNKILKIAKMSLLVTVKTSSDGLDATGFTVKSHSAELAKATKILLGLNLALPDPLLTLPYWLSGLL